jgi:hypothetical protein
MSNRCTSACGSPTAGRPRTRAGSQAPLARSQRGPILNPVSFGAGRRHLDRSYWVWPLPPAGPLTFACEWAAFGIPEARAGTDAQPILDAARRSVQLWPLADP